MRRVETAALLVRSVAYGESDLVATFFTLTDGKLSAMVRGARRSQKRFGGALEPIHELFVTLDDKGRELALLKEARIARPRTGVTASLDAMDAAGRALRWVRYLCPPRTPEPETWRGLTRLLDQLDAPMAAEANASRESFLAPLAGFGLALLTEVGYGLELERCVRCGRPCPPGKPSMIDAKGGGLVCSACGGARRTIGPDLREAALRLSRGEESSLSGAQAEALLEIVEDAMAAHADFDTSSR